MPVFELPSWSNMNDDQCCSQRAAGLWPWDVKDARGEEGDQSGPLRMGFGSVYAGSRWAC
jgi:hypothetical protein